MFDTAKSHAAAGRLQEALQSFAAAAALEPACVDLLVEYGYALKDARRLSDAHQRFVDAQKIDPHNVRVLNGLGLVLNDMDLPEQALQCFQAALEVAPSQPLILTNMASSLTRLGRLDEAIESCNSALQASAEFTPALIALSLAMAASTQPFRQPRAIELLAATRSTDATVIQGRAIALQELDRHGEALDLLKQAAARDPQDVVAQALLSTAALLMGDFETGWNTFEARWTAPGGLARPYASQIQTPMWDGSADISGKSIFVYAEQGHGDTIQFSRYCSLLAERGARVLFAVQDALEPVLRDLPGVSRLLTSGQCVPQFDLHCAVMSLPRAFATRLESIPPQRKALVAPAERIARWQHMLGTKQRPRVALAWSGNPSQSNDVNRSMPLEALLPLLQLDIEFVSVQRAVTHAQQALLKSNGLLRDLHGEIHDFGDVAAIMALSDLVISVDTANAHLAGAMHRPTWICLTRRADWRYLLDRQDTPWYPSARLYRQQRAGDWSGVVAKVKADLQERFPPGAP